MQRRQDYVQKDKWSRLLPSLAAASAATAEPAAAVPAAVPTAAQPATEPTAADA